MVSCNDCAHKDMCGNKDAYEKILNARSSDFNNFASTLAAILAVIGGDCKGYDTETL